jgi:hypothetical protein
LIAAANDLGRNAK